MGLASASFCLADPMRVVTVDMNQVLSDSIEGKALSSTLEDEMKKKQASFAAQRGEIAKIQSEVQKQSALLSQAARDEKRSSLEKREREFNRAMQDAQETFARKKNAGIEEIVKRARDVIQQLAKEEGFGYVIEKDPRVVLIADSKLDVTAKVIERLNQIKLDS